MAEKLREMDRKEKVREIALSSVNTEDAIQVDTGSFLVETALGFAEIKVVAKNSTFGKAEAQEAVDEYARKLKDRKEKAEKAEKAKAEKLAKAKAKKAQAE
jgi:hypothetical protein